MNASEQAQKGFKTFVLTLAVSLIVFSVIYYVVTNGRPSLEQRTAAVQNDSVSEAKSGGDKDLGDTKDSAFSQLAAAKMNVPSKAVLAGSTTAGQTTQSTASVPETGSVGITIGFISSVLLFGAWVAYVIKNPRVLALRSFERRVLKGL